MDIARCIGCGCTDFHACHGEGGPCHWLEVDYDAGVGVCSECEDHLDRWNAGDRTIKASMTLAKITRDGEPGEPFYLESSDMASFPLHLGTEVGSRFHIEWVEMTVQEFEALPQFEHLRLASQWNHHMEEAEADEANGEAESAQQHRKQAAEIEERLNQMGFDVHDLLELIE